MAEMLCCPGILDFTVDIEPTVEPPVAAAAGGDAAGAAEPAAVSKALPFPCAFTARLLKTRLLCSLPFKLLRQCLLLRPVCLSSGGGRGLGLGAGVGPQVSARNRPLVLSLPLRKRPAFFLTGDRCVSSAAASAAEMKSYVAGDDLVVSDEADEKDAANPLKRLSAKTNVRRTLNL